MVEILTRQALHQLVRLGLVEGLADAARAVVQALELEVHFTSTGYSEFVLIRRRIGQPLLPSSGTSRTWRRGRRRAGEAAVA